MDHINYLKWKKSNNFLWCNKIFLISYYKQVLDHFNYRPESYNTFEQIYFIKGGADSSAPIFVCLGAEQPIDDDPQIIGFMTHNVAPFKALLVYIEVII